MTKRVELAGLQVDAELADFVNKEVLPAAGLPQDRFWAGFESIVSKFTPANIQLLARRNNLQASIDQWHRDRNGQPHHAPAYKRFLQEIGYLEQEGEDFSISTRNIDSEIALQAGPQLVVPVKNARFALNAANARWGSLYDALYGSDVIAEEDGAEAKGAYNPVRGERVIAFARQFLDQVCPLDGASHSDADSYRVDQGKLLVSVAGREVTLADQQQLKGLKGVDEAPVSILLINNGLHIEILFDKKSSVAASDRGGISDIILEAAVTTIQDCEDSVTAVDGADKVEVYRNWLGLIQGNLEETFEKEGSSFTRVLNKDRFYFSLTSERFSLPGRSLLLIRNVGHLMRSPAILDRHGEKVYEGLMDGVLTSTIASIDVNGKSSLRNSRTGSIYIVKPKMHGPDEVRFSCDLFSAIEKMLGLINNTIKIGIMDEERRTSLNLKECIRAAKSRVVFINTGFLDRTGDEIHTSMEAGPVLPKSEMKDSDWIKAYEDNNVDVGLACGFSGKAQIGKGMWAMPDLLARMLDEKIAHPQSGATTAWVPSPMAAVLHAIHYHRVNVFERQQELKNREPAKKEDILKLPIMDDPVSLSSEEVQQELDNNAQGILGYVVRWVEQGVGCSKVPDIHNIGLMEDRATLRISSQHIANWLRHGVCSREQVEETLKRMAAVVDDQNRHELLYQAMSVNFESSIAFKAACELVFEGRGQANGYTEPTLHAHRGEYKARQVLSSFG